MARKKHGEKIRNYNFRNFPLFIFILLLTISTFPQRKQPPEKILELDRLLENYSSTKEMNTHIQKLTAYELQHSAKIFFEAFEANAVEANKFLAIRDKKIDSLNKSLKSDYMNSEVMLGQTKLALMKEFRKRFPNDIYALIIVPYLLKIKVTNINKFIYRDTTSTAQLPRTDIEAVVLEVLKGESKFKINDRILFYYMDHWRLTRSDFKTGEIYLVPLTPMSEYDLNFHLTALITHLETESNKIEADKNINDSYGMFPIIDENIIDINNFWGYGKKIKWDNFKQEINNKITLIKSW